MIPGTRVSASLDEAPLESAIGDSCRHKTEIYRPPNLTCSHRSPYHAQSSCRRPGAAPPPLPLERGRVFAPVDPETFLCPPTPTSSSNGYYRFAATLLPARSATMSSFPRISTVEKGALPRPCKENTIWITDTRRSTNTDSKSSPKH